MNYLHSQLNYQPTGTIIEVALKGSECNVFLVDSSNFSNYKNGRQYRYYGGRATQSPVRLQVPFSSNWHLIIDGGKVSASHPRIIRP